MTTREDIESFLMRLDVDVEEVEEGFWVLKTPGNETPIVVNYTPPVLVLRIKVMDLPPDSGDDTRLAAFYRRLLELNATDILHGSYGLDEHEVVLSDALELEDLDFSELRSSYESLQLAASGHMAGLAELIPVAQQG